MNENSFGGAPNGAGGPPPGAGGPQGGWEIRWDMLL